MVFKHGFVGEEHNKNSKRLFLLLCMMLHLRFSVKERAWIIFTGGNLKYGCYGFTADWSHLLLAVLKASERI